MKHQRRTGTGGMQKLRLRDGQLGQGDIEKDSGQDVWGAGVRYELVGGPEEKKKGERKHSINDYLNSQRLRRQPVFMIESITIHARLLWNQQSLL